MKKKSIEQIKMNDWQSGTGWYEVDMENLTTLTTLTTQQIRAIYNRNI